jgi:acetate kinase
MTNQPDTTTLVLNAGSSSLKLAVFDAAHPEVELASGSVQRVGGDAAQLAVAWGAAAEERNPIACADHGQALHLLLEALDTLCAGWRDGVRAVGHRVVHGGARYTEPTVLTHEVERELDSLTELAPLHNARAVDVIRASLRAIPGVPQVACFDTAFHADLPAVTRRYALPRELADRYGIRRYGFHGLSCEGSMRTLAALNLDSMVRVIICHLGAGASITAVLNGRSIDTSMGFTPLEGLPMATRSGSIDPSIPQYLERHAGMTAEDVDRLLERESGLLGLSGTSGDVAQLEAAAEGGDAPALEALNAFAYAVRRTIGGYLAILGGLDVLVLTGGIGEHGMQMRRRILEPLAHLGLTLDGDANAEAGGEQPVRISRDGAAIDVWVIPAREEAVIARQVAETIE